MFTLEIFQRPNLGRRPRSTSEAYSAEHKKNLKAWALALWQARSTNWNPAQFRTASVAPRSDARCRAWLVTSIFYVFDERRPRRHFSYAHLDPGEVIFITYSPPPAIFFGLSSGYLDIHLIFDCDLQSLPLNETSPRMFTEVVITLKEY